MTAKKHANTLSLLNIIKDKLCSEELVTVEVALNDLCKIVDKNCTRDSNPLAEYFDEKPSFDSIVEISILDNCFEMFKSSLSTDTILRLIKMSLKSVSRDNYSIAVLSINEIINRKDIKAQKKIIQQFKSACKHYDFGHRYREDTVLDKLYDCLFKEFECDALISLLKKADVQMFDPQDGDDADHLFISAFEKCETNADLKKLTTAFYRYKNKRVSSLGAAYFSDFQVEIATVLDLKQKQSFEKEMESKAKEFRIFDLLDSNKKEDILELIGEIGKKERSKYIHENGGLVADKILSRDDISKEELFQAVEGFVKQKENGCTIKLCINLIKNNEKISVIALLKNKHTKNNEDDLFFVAREIITHLKKGGASINELKPWFEFAQVFSAGNDSQLFSEEIAAKFSEILEMSTYNESFHEAISQLDEIVGLIKKPPVEVYYLHLNKGLTALAQKDEVEAWQAIKTICLCLFNVMIEQQIFRGLHIAIIACGKTNDMDSANAFEAYVPKDTDDTRLTFSLASVYALLSVKEKMLYYINRSIELGKVADLFMEDTSFNGYWKDKDFLEALSK